MNDNAMAQYKPAYLADAFGLERAEAEAIINASGTDRGRALELARQQKVRNDSRPTSSRS